MTTAKAKCRRQPSDSRRTKFNLQQRIAVEGAYWSFRFAPGQVSVARNRPLCSAELGKILEDIDQFRSSVAAGRPLICLDVGTKTIGIAVSDVRCAVASPLVTVTRAKATQDAREIGEIAQGRQATGIVLGLPRNMNGSEGPRCQSVRAFAKTLAGLLDLPITYWDERLSTVEAERSLLEGGLSRRRRAELVNHVAASIILQGLLDRLASADATN